MLNRKLEMDSLQLFPKWFTIIRTKTDVIHAAN